MSGPGLKRLLTGKTQYHTENPIPGKRRRKWNGSRIFSKMKSGASAVEYGLLVALISVVIITAVSLLGTNLSNVFNSAAGHLVAAS